MLLENRQPTGKLSEKTAHSGWAPKLHIAAAKLLQADHAAVVHKYLALQMPYRDAVTFMKASGEKLSMDTG